MSLDDIKRGILPYNDLKSINKHDFIITYLNRNFTISNHNRYNVIIIYSRYIRKFGHDFVKEQALNLNDKTVTTWLLYTLDKYKYIVDIENEEFECRLEELQERLGIMNKSLIDVFRKYMPFITGRDIYRFAFDNIDSPNFDYFYLLLILFYEDEYPNDASKIFPKNYSCCSYNDKSGRDKPCPFSEKCKNENICVAFESKYGKDYDFVQEFNDFQKEIIVKFLRFAPKKIKDKALVKLYESFKQINQTNLFEEKLSLSLDKFLCNKDNPLTGEFYLPWSKVEFYNGFYLISHPNVSLDRKSFYKIEDSSSREIFNDINKLFLKRLYPIHVKAENGHIVKVLNKSNLRECISVLEHKINVTFTKKERKDRTKVEKRELTINEAKDLCKELKSRYLDNLCVRQIENYKVICCIEHRINSSGVVHDEYSFIFTVKESKDKIYLVYENAANSRSTYILPIARGTWGDSIEHIYNFFASDEVNKRQQMASRLVDLKLPGKYEYKRVFHTDYYSWNCKIRELLMDARVCL